MATAATHQRQGFGQLLLMFAIDAARQERAKLAVLVQCTYDCYRFL
jgi:GNAT superfamily N-acetyltransferase